ncbi:MAG: SGNH/GDSL hydrolase family protein [Actinobacteria bacterium]|nr:SGNH/GDSL hydrolase family protein [Actinomycetota bacterium]MCB9412684.1 SGNH/GDSL hydrolase family protein [Actinomycetota bacterium]
MEDTSTASDFRRPAAPLPTSFVALGDSFTEGMDDEGLGGTYVGWADRLAMLVARSGAPSGFGYANLAIRGKRAAEVLEEQVPVAAALRPDLVSYAAGVNDAMRPVFDLDHVVACEEAAVQQLREAGAQVLLFCFGDPGRRSAVVGRLSERIRAMNSHTRRIALDYDCFVADFWGERLFDDPRLWSPDRLHLSPLGHTRVAAGVAEALGWGDSDWREPLPTAPPTPWTARRRSDIDWLRHHFGPWVVRRIRQQSSGAGIEPKLPELAPVTSGIPWWSDSSDQPEAALARP